MSTYVEVRAAIRALSAALERMYVAREMHLLVLTEAEVVRLSLAVEDCASHDALASPEMF